MTTKRKIVLLHHADADGFGACFAAWHGLTACEKADEPELLVLPVQYGQEPPWEELKAFAPDQVYILDFSYKAEPLRLLMEAYDVVVLDHHKSAAEELHGFTSIMTHADGSQMGVLIDQSKSGAVIAWQHFNPETPIPEILLYVQDRDLWKWELEHSREINAFIGTLPWDFDVWMDFYTPEAYDAGKAILRFQANQVASRVKAATLVEFNTEKLKFGGLWLPEPKVEVPIVNATENISELGSALAEAYPDAPFTVSYCDRPDGKRSYSLRSRNGFDVSVVAKAFGGGGHPGSAGFTMPAPPIFSPELIVTDQRLDEAKKQIAASMPQDLGMYRIGDPTFHTVMVGDFTICRQSEGKVWVQTSEGEGGEFDEAKLEKAISAFYVEHF